MDVVQVIRAKLDAGQLPHHDYVIRWIRDGQSRCCGACAQPIPPSVREHELHFADGRKIYFHALCVGRYEAELRRRRKGEAAMNKTWGDLKRAVEAAGATNETVIGYIDISHVHNAWNIVVFEKNGEDTLTVNG